MRPLALSVTFLASLSTTLALEACDEGPLDCSALCERGQDEDCSWFEGECTEFCEALTNLEDDSDCGDERRDWEECLNDEDACSNECEDEELAVSTCITVYCTAELTNLDCMTLIDAF